MLRATQATAQKSKLLLDACKGGDLPLVRRLTASLYNKDEHEPRLVPPLRTVLCAAARNGHSDILRFYFDEVPACRDEPWGPWCPSIGSVNVEDMPAEWRVDSPHNKVAIAAVESGKPEVFQTLLDYGMNVNAAPEKYNTPFEYALHDGDFAMARFLLAKGANIYGNGEPLGASTTVRDAAKSGNVETLRFLLDHGAKLDGTNALEGAAQTGCVATAEILLENGVNIDEIFEQIYSFLDPEDEARCSALHTAVKEGHADFVRFLLQHGANLDVQDGIRQTPIQLAEKYGKTEILEILRQAKEKKQKSDQERG